MSLPNLAGVATTELVEQIGGGQFKASYINWSRTMHLLREHASGWMPEIVQNTDGGILHRAPVGAYLMIRFVHVDGRATVAVPQAIMDNTNKSIPLERITARDVTDTHRRGICMAAALIFGLAYELWAKIPLESGYREDADTQPEKTEEGGSVFNKRHFDAAVEKFGEDFAIVAESIDEGDWDTAVDVYHKIPKAAVDAVWFAPTKLEKIGVTPVFTTAHRAAVKSNEWHAARKRLFEADKPA